MNDDTQWNPDVTVSRMTAATAADLLREYERTLHRAGVRDGHADDVAETIVELDAALGNQSVEL